MKGMQTAAVALVLVSSTAVHADEITLAQGGDGALADAAVVYRASGMQPGR